MSTFITVGNARQPFARLLRAAAEAHHLLPKPVFVQRGSTDFAHAEWNVSDFMEMQEFERLVRESTLLIMHAGAGSIVSALRAGKYPVVMPRRARHGEIIDDHQTEFAAALASAGRVAVAAEPADMPAAIQLACAGAEARRQAVSPPLVEHVSKLLASLALPGNLR